jgi:hypothetical protein
MAKTASEIAIEQRAKFEFYLLGLTFGILGLSIQTAKFGNFLIADSLELLGWLVLFASGVVGMLRGEWIPVAYDINHKINSTESQISQVLQGIQQGVDVPLTFVENGQEQVLHGQEAVTKLEGVVTELQLQHAAAHARILKRYGWMKWLFVAGIASLLTARAYPPAYAVGESLYYFGKRFIES